jgi:hypothetical protein
MTKAFCAVTREKKVKDEKHFSPPSRSREEELDEKSLALV